MDVASSSLMGQSGGARKMDRPPFQGRPSRGRSHHSLVTPLDWKPSNQNKKGSSEITGHHSLVTPLDWKLQCRRMGVGMDQVTTRW